MVGADISHLFLNNFVPSKVLSQCDINGHTPSGNPPQYLSSKPFSDICRRCGIPYYRSMTSEEQRQFNEDIRKAADF